MSTQYFNINMDPVVGDALSAHALMPDGSIIVVWSEEVNEPETKVFMRHVSATGEPLGKPILVADALTESTGWVSVTVGLDGTIVVVFSDEDAGDGATPDAGIFLQRFNPDFSKLGGAVAVNTETNYRHDYNDVTTLADGGFVVSYFSFGDDPTNDFDAYFQRFDEFGVPVGPETSVTLSLANTQAYTEIVALPDGGWVALYSGADTADGDAVMLRLQRFDATGARVGTEQSLTTPTLPDALPRAVLIDNGNLAITFTEINVVPNTYEIWFMITDQSGTQVLAPVNLSGSIDQDGQIYSAVTQLNDGRIVVTWTSFSELSTSGTGTSYYQILSDTGALIGTPQSAGAVNPGYGLTSVVALNGGGFMIVSTGQSGDIVGQIFLQASDQADNLTMDGGGTLRALKGADLIQGSSDIDIVYGGADADTLYGNDGDDILFGGGGSTGRTQYLFGGSGNDLLSGGSKEDDLRGGTGNDVLWGKDGNDNLQGGDDDDLIKGGAGDDFADGGSGKDDIRGGQGDDTLDGGNSADRLSGGVGNDQIIGGGGADTIIGGLGDDEMTGNLGRDEFVFAQVDFGTDIITDWEDTRDLIDVNIAGVTFADVTITDIGTNALVEFAGGEIIVMGGGGLLNTDDFSF